jgi:hypothetical protein
MGKQAHTFPEGWEQAWKVNLNQCRLLHVPTRLRVELRHTDGGVWYPFALNGEEWVAEDPSRLEDFTPLMMQAFALFREQAPKT